MKLANPEECLDRRAQVLFVADQMPFQIGPLTFCLLQPLMTADGARFGELGEVFPNRGRVWWMLRERLGEVTPGSLWSSRLQPASIEDVERPDKDHYQVAREDIEPGSKDWVSVVEFERDLPPIHEILEGQLPAPPTRPAKEVLLRFRDATVGPFRLGEWSRGGALHVTPLDLNRAAVRRTTAPKLPGEQRFDLDLARLSRHSDEIPFHATIVLVPRKAALALEGDELDAMSAAQVVKWALEKAGYSKGQQKPVREALDAVAKAPVSAADEARLQRFRDLCARAIHNVDLGAAVAAELAKHEGFQPFFERHREELLQAEVQRLVGERTRQIEESLAAKQQELESKRTELKAAQQQYDAMRAEQEQRLAEENTAWIDGLRRREEEVKRAERDLEERQGRMSDALSGAIAEYRERAQDVLQNVLTLMPLLPASSPGAARPTVTEPTLLPAWIDQPKTKAGVLEREPAFVQQFQDVVQRRGFVFEPEVLAAFHVAVKTGAWTVLAGPSGLGKSSLPALYAEALGQRQEMLSVAVRPDWLDDRQVLGAFNPLTERFETAATGITEHLIHAAEDARRQRGGIYLIVLDEMNLARVEHYFARFLSIMERRADERTLELFSRTQENPNDPMARHRQLLVPPNVRFVGTVNLDETIHFFSPKVLDRCAIVALGQGPLDPAIVPNAQARELGLPCVPFATYAGWVQPVTACPTAFQGLLVRLDEVLRGARSGLGYRSFQRARTFAASAKGVLADDVAADFAIFQYVLPRIRTLQRDAQGLLGELKRLLPEDRFPRSANAMTRMHEGDEFFHVIG